MAGHSKWAQIKRQKGVNDAKRGALFTRLGNMIAIAARGGTDPATNATLAMAIEKAKSYNMPLSNIERSIQRVKDKAATNVEEVLYEGYGPGGVAILVECATDNKNRTYPEVRHAFTKHGGSIAEANSVAFQFSRKGVITVNASGDDTMLTILDAGAEDAVEQDGETIVYTDPKELAKVRTSLAAAEVPIREAELSYIPNNTLEITDQATADKIIRLMEALEDLDDVVNTHTNFDISV
jgi:YebC/PmpR family DNA-binding regulatory protein